MIRKTTTGPKIKDQMKTHYDDEVTDALVAASLRPLKQEPTDEQMEAIFSSQIELAERNESVFWAARGNLVRFLSASDEEFEDSSVDLEELKYAAMNRENADNEFDEDMQNAIEEARKKALNELDEEARDDSTEAENEDD